MRFNNLILFIVPALIWGSTWYVIKFQLGVVDPLVSVGYRFVIAGLLLLVYCYFFKYNLKFKIREHFQMGLQGLFLFGLNYWLVYESEMFLTSGLVAISFSTLIFMNIIFGAIILRYQIKKSIVLGATLGIIGTGFMFHPELEAYNFSDTNFIGLVMCLSGVVLASLGNITSAYNQRKKIPVIQNNAYGMLYGALMMFVIALVTGRPFTFDTSFSYLSSLVYLVIFGSIIAFGCYLTLIGKIGADKAAYVILVVPIVALIISTIFENYQWTIHSVTGTVLILAGNFLAMRKDKVKVSPQKS
ncbi:EamA family transporter [Fulvivirgaceae bacterium BMA10]|uniref:EamA family transporter n=1 Tax=Splendidivirga corallicola TaxID=3051826 RepID=A0ABT8KQE1_9BACT|nr:EamA family transporter [Fulvivirgaceae bacterium BMA10]